MFIELQMPDRDRVIKSMDSAGRVLRSGRDQDDKSDSPDSIKLTARQRERIERNRQKALLLRKSRVANLPNADKIIYQKEVNVVSRPRDTGGGFFLEDEDANEPNVEDRPVVHPPAPLPAADRPKCELCDQEFSDSFLQKHFDHLVCDNCRDNDDVHSLISKTDAKREYLLKDCDLEKREPPLRFILRKNPHNKYGSMKLYLKLQVEKRALEIHGSEDQMDEIRELREDAQEKRKQKAFDKKVKALRMEVRSSLYRKTAASHQHTYGAESYVKDDDVYQKTCTTCGHTLQYEKM